MNKDFSRRMTVVMVTKKTAFLQLPEQPIKKYNLWTKFMCTYCYGGKSLKISEQSQQVVLEMKCCNYQIFNFVKNDFKVKN